MKCFILAAGFGKRMEELTQNLPKPLLPYKGKTLLDHSIQFAVDLGFTEFIINTHYLADKIHEHLKRYTDYKIHISYETEILGTGGGLKTGLVQAQGIVSNNDYILTLNPDVLLTAKPEDIKGQIYSYTGDCLLFLTQLEPGESYTALDLQEGKVSFQPGKYFYIGMSIIKVNALKDIPERSFFDLSELFRTLSKRKCLDGVLFPGKVFDVGDKKKYLNLTNFSK